MHKLLKILMGCLLGSIGIILLRHAHLVTGGVPGLALGVSYLLGVPFSLIYLVISIPFYILSIMRMGWNFTLWTGFAAVSLSFMTDLDRYLPAFIVPDWAGAILGGVFLGFCLSFLFLNGASLGGVNILVLYLHKRFGWDPGKTTFIIDSTITIFGIYAVGLWKGMYSILSVVILSAIISYYKGQIAAADVPGDNLAIDEKNM